MLISGESPLDIAAMQAIIHVSARMFSLLPSFHVREESSVLVLRFPICENNLESIRLAGWSKYLSRIATKISRATRKIKSAQLP
jgi:hypothetical protein